MQGSKAAIIENNRIQHGLRKDQRCGVQALPVASQPICTHSALPTKTSHSAAQQHRAHDECVCKIRQRIAGKRARRAQRKIRNLQQIRRGSFSDYANSLFSKGILEPRARVELATCRLRRGISILVSVCFIKYLHIFAFQSG